MKVRASRNENVQRVEKNMARGTAAPGQMTDTIDMIAKVDAHDHHQRIPEVIHITGMASIATVASTTATLLETLGMISSIKTTLVLHLPGHQNLLPILVLHLRISNSQMPRGHQR